MNDPMVFRPDERFYGIGHPRALRFPPVLWLWRRLACRRGWHLFSEAAHGPPHEWYLNCSACDLAVHIKSIDTRYARSQRPAWAAKVEKLPLHVRLPDGDLP